MAFQNKPGFGSLFVNKYKEAGDNKPDRSGTINVGGVDMELAGWLKRTKDGTPYLSLSIKPMKAKEDANVRSTETPVDFEPLGADDEVPF